METESHAATHVKNEGAGAVFCARGLGLISLTQPHGLCPASSPVCLLISVFSLATISLPIKQEYIKK